MGSFIKSLDINQNEQLYFLIFDSSQEYIWFSYKLNLIFSLIACWNKLFKSVTRLKIVFFKAVGIFCKMVFIHDVESKYVQHGFEWHSFWLMGTRSVWLSLDYLPNPKNKKKRAILFLLHCVIKRDGAWACIINWFIAHMIIRWGSVFSLNTKDAKIFSILKYRLNSRLRCFEN